jgi:hypothetical protein
MPKPYTCPALLDEVKSVSISFLSKHNYLKPDQLRSGSVTWSINGNSTGSISIKVNTHLEQSYIELDYKCNGVLINYRVQLISAPSNLGKGVVWYFICPSTRKRCRKLYLVDTYFYHRSAFRGCMYEKQTQSKSNRYLDKTMEAYFRSDQIFEKLHQKHFKKYYADKPTKKYLQLIKIIQRSERIIYSLDKDFF